MQDSLKLLNRSSVLISFLISARVLGWARRKAISQMIGDLHRPKPTRRC
jgi:hypothetical protein